MVPLKISSAFWMSGSFLKSSLLNGTGAVFFSAAVLGRLRTARRVGGAAFGGGPGRAGGRERLGLAHPAGGRLGLDELDHGVGLAQFGELGGQQGVVARIVHQAEMILKFGIEPDDENIFLE